MDKPKDLSSRLQAHSVAAVSELSSVSTKTIYRIRQDPSYSFTRKIEERLTGAMRQIEQQSKRRRRNRRDEQAES